MSNHYDIIIIGTGSGGSTMAYKLAPTGKKILILERGGFIPKELEFWVHSIMLFCLITSITEESFFLTHQW